MVLIRNLLVLPPRQQPGCSDTSSDAIALPPLQATEAVASLRGALGELVGFAQLTRFRLVVERRGPSADAKASSTRSAEVDAVVNRHVLRWADVCAPSALALDGLDETALDDYGDLSPLVAALGGGREGDEAAGKTADDTAADDTAADDDDSRPLLLDASDLALRVVLERYDVASVREQIERVRALFGGNAPALGALYEADVGVADGQQEQQQQQKEGAADAGKVGSEKATEAADNHNKPTTQEEAIKARAQMAAQLPKFPSSYDLTLQHATSGGDYTHFYTLACGEELDLLHTCNHVKKSAAVDEFMQDLIDPSKKTKNQKKKRNGATKNNKQQQQQHDDTNKPTPSFSVTEIEQILHTLNSITIIDATIRLSGYHNPPPHRQALGDLAYIECLTPAQPTIHITAFSKGFYINKSTNVNFDPTPAIDPCYSHSLLDCLLQKSQYLREAWTAALQASEKRANLLKTVSSSEDAFAQLYRPATSAHFNNHSGTSLGSGIMTVAPSTFVTRLDAVTLRPSWLIPLPKSNNNKSISTYKQHDNLHKWNVGRAEEELTQMYGMDVKNGGLRDWNEELQSARDMSSDTFEERMERARMIHKVLSDFSEASLTGIRAITQGHITPMNPNEPARSHVYLHNNIFFSRAVDAGLDTFKVVQGDGAAKKSAGKEASNVGVLHRLDKRGLYTLGTVLVEYLGTRFVCQTVVPGILHGEKGHTLSYGAVEALAELECEEEMHRVLEDSLGEHCMVATRGVLSRPYTEDRVEAIKEFKSTLTSPLIGKEEAKEDDGSVKVNNICGPIEMKGIIGSDKRKYVLDCTRLTPRDANWISKANGGTGYWEEVSSSSEFIPSDLDDDEWVASVLRPELVAHYGDEKLKGFLLARQAKEATNTVNASKTDDEGAAANKENPANDAVDKDKDWVDVKKSDEKTEAELEQRQKEEEEFILTLRYNVNVFLPYVKSIESIDKDAHEQIKRDEVEARKLADYLWNTVLPAVTKNIRLDNFKTIQIPVDGKSLTEFLHQHGVNCRYLGRLAELAKIEERNDIDARKAYESNKKDNKSPRFKMPLCWLEMLECEMVARAAKHVLDSYLTENGGAAAVQPAHTIASFLSAVVSVGEETASETEVRTAVAGEGAVNTDEINALTLFDANVNEPVRGRAEIWSDIEKEVGRRFRYTLSLYNKGKPNDRALYTPLLRRICQRSGIRLVAKAYDIGKKCACGEGSSYPIAAVDILDVLPLVKHAASGGEDAFSPCRFDGNNTSSLHIVFADAIAISEAAKCHFSTGNIALAAEYAQEAASLYQRVIDSPLHEQIVKSLFLVSKCHSVGQDHEAAINAALKYLAISVSVGGFDCREALDAHNQLSDAYIAAGKLKEGVKHLRALLYLMEFVAGGNFTQLSAIYYKLGTQYVECEKPAEALSFYYAAKKKLTHDSLVDGIIASSLAMAYAHLGKFSEASSEEKIAYQLYKSHLGEDHDRTKLSSNHLLQFMRLAMEQGKIVAAKKNMQARETEADAIAASIKAEEDRAESAAKKKKKKKKKSKSGNASENENGNTARNASKAA